MACYVGRHSSHKCSDIDEAGDKFRKLIQDDIGTVGKQIELHVANSDRIEQLRRERTEFETDVDAIEVLISQRSEELKRLIDKQKMAMLDELFEIKQNTVHKIDNIDEHYRILKTFKEYVQEVKDNGTSSDIASQACSIHARAMELEGTDVVDIAESNLFKIALISSTFIDESTLTKDNLFGKIDKQHRSVGGKCTFL